MSTQYIRGSKAARFLFVGAFICFWIFAFHRNGGLPDLNSTGLDSWTHRAEEDPTPFPADHPFHDSFTDDVSVPEVGEHDTSPTHDTPAHGGPHQDGSIQDTSIHHPVDHDSHLPPPNPANPQSLSGLSELVEHNPNLPNPSPVRASTHQRFLTIATMLRNERRWLREWIEFYLMMGADHFIIYDNDSKDLPLDILQHYVDQGQVTYVPWPPQAVPPPDTFHTALDEWQYNWFKDTLETCLYDEWIIHKHAPCQMAAFADAIRRTKGGVSRWLGILDVDEYIFPIPTSGIRSLAALLRQEESSDHLVIHGGTFGTSGHVDHAARRRPGDAVQALVTEEYTYRAPYDHHGDHPGGQVQGEWHLHGHGQLGDSVLTDGWTGDVTKAFADPDFVSHSSIHHFNPYDWSHWNEKYFWTGDPVWKYNHYTMLSMADVRRKAEVNGNPILDSFSSEMNEFYSRERDTDILEYVPQLKQRMLDVIRQHPPPRPDDWEATLETSI